MLKFSHQYTISGKLDLYTAVLQVKFPAVRIPCAHAARGDLWPPPRAPGTAPCAAPPAGLPRYRYEGT